jgi:hypothetical protein
MTRQHLLFGLALGVVAGCGSVDGGALYGDVERSEASALDGEFLDANTSPGPGVAGPTQLDFAGAEAPVDPMTDDDDGNVDGADGTVDIDDGAPEVDEHPSAVDDAPPTIEWTEPSDGAVAVAADAEIVIQFSEAMDSAATEAALEGDLGADVSFEWSDGDTRLTLRPATALAYATGPEPLEPLRYAVGFGANARDVAGNALTESIFTFATRREVQVELEPVSDPRLTGTVRADGQATGGDCATALCAGDASALNIGAPETQHKAFLSFDLSTLPLNLIELRGAHLEVRTEDTLGAPFDGLGELHVERSDFRRIGSAAFDADPDATLGVLASEAPLTSGDIRWVVQEDLAAGRYSQFRLCFPQINDNDGATDLVRFAPSEQRLSITFISP